MDVEKALAISDRPLGYTHNEQVIARIVLAAEVRKLQNLAGTWELAALAALSERLDKETAGRVGERMREIVRERAARNGPPATKGDS